MTRGACYILGVALAVLCLSVALAAWAVNAMVPTNLITKKEYTE